MALNFGPTFFNWSFASLDLAAPKNEAEGQHKNEELTIYTERARLRPLKSKAVSPPFIILFVTYSFAWPINPATVTLWHDRPSKTNPNTKLENVPQRSVRLKQRSTTAKDIVLVKWRIHLLWLGLLRGRSNSGKLCALRFFPLSGSRHITMYRSPARPSKRHRFAEAEKRPI